MRIELTPDELIALRARIAASEDCEETGEGEFVADLYDAIKPMSVQLTLDGKGIEVLAAEYLAFDEELDGWYLCGPVDDAEEIRRALDTLSA